MGLLKQKQNQKVGKYVLGAKIGVGGFGVVRKAVHEETKVEVAVKILDKAQLQLMQMTQQIKREITLFTTLKHTNIVNGYEVLTSPTKLYMVMEYVDGGDMHSLISERRRIDEDEAHRYFVGLIECLAYCHERGVTHRDLKLENLLVTKRGELKVCDFGLASVRALNSDSTSQLCSTIVGTEDFAAPEILQQIPYSGEKADMWSAGIILYTMLAGYCPFRGEDTSSLFEAIKSCRYTFPNDFPAGAKHVVSQLLVLNPERRPSSWDLLNLEWMRVRETPIDEYNSIVEVPEPEDVSDEYISAKEPSSRKRGSGGPEGSPNTSFLSEKEAMSASTLRKQIQQNPALLLASQTIDGFSQLYDAMRQTPGLVKDRRFRMRVYPKTFVGEELVAWLAHYSGVSRSEAVRIGDKMLQAEVFHHVCRDHSFKDEYLFYRFAEDDEDNSGVLNMLQIWPSTAPAREPLPVSMNLLNSVLALMKIHQAIAKPGSDEAPEVNVEMLREDQAFFAFRMATAELQAVDLSLLNTTKAKKAFLINLYHVMILHIRIYMGGHLPDRSPLRERSRLQYNIAGSRLHIADIASLLGASKALDEDSGQTSKSSSNSLSPKTVIPSPKLGSKRNPPGSSPKQSANRAAMASLFTGLSHRSDGGSSSAISVLRFEQDDSDLIPLFLSDGSPSSSSIRALDEEDIGMDALKVALTRDLVRQMKVVNKSSLLLPNVMIGFRKLSKLTGERELCVQISNLLGMLLKRSSSADEPENHVDELERTTELLKEVRSMISSGIPVHIAFDDYDDAHFAPHIVVRQGIEGSKTGEV